MEALLETDEDALKLKSAKGRKNDPLIHINFGQLDT